MQWTEENVGVHDHVKPGWMESMFIEIAWIGIVDEKVQRTDNQVILRIDYKGEPVVVIVGIEENDRRARDNEGSDDERENSTEKQLKAKRMTDAGRDADEPVEKGDHGEGGKGRTIENTQCANDTDSQGSDGQVTIDHHRSRCSARLIGCVIETLHDR